MLLDASRAGGDAALRDLAEQEIAARAEDPERQATRPPAGPRMALVEMDDLLAGGARRPATWPAAVVGVFGALPQALGARRVGLATLALGVVAGMALGWWTAGITRQAPPAAPATMVVQPATYVPAPIATKAPPPVRTAVADVSPPVAEPPSSAPKINRHRSPAIVAVKLHRSPPARRATRAPTGDPQRLARLYEEGVRKLQVSTAPR